MDPSLSGNVDDQSKSSTLGMEEKRDLVYKLFKRPQNAAEVLHSWSRRDLIEILCAERGQERKYTGLTKYRIIEILLNIVSEKNSGKQIEYIGSTPDSPPRNRETSSKRQRKPDHPSRLPIATKYLPRSNDNEAINIKRYCLNLACRATLSLKDAFCKRCSCCICHKYDENKDPSLWLVCSSEIPFQGDSCGLSCHLECAFKHERAAIAKHCKRLDGSYFCTNCGKVNDLLGCWRKQLLIAKDARRVDILCYRVSLSHKLLNSTEKYQSLHDIVDTAMKKLEGEVGSLKIPVNMARGIVNRLSVGAEVQKLCAHAIESLDSMLSSVSKSPSDLKIQKASLISSSFITFEGMSPTSLTVVLSSEENVSLPEESVWYTLWHRKSDMEDYPTVPTCTLFKPQGSFLVSGLTPGTEYIFKVAAFSSKGELEKCEVAVTTDSISKDVTTNLVVEGISLKPHGGSSKTNSSEVYTPSYGEESNDTIALRDLDNQSPDSYFGNCEELEIPDLKKSSDHACKEENRSQNTCTYTVINRAEAEQEETVGNSVSAVDEEPNLTIPVESHKDSTHSTEHIQASDVPKFENKMMVVPYGPSESARPVTPSRLEIDKEGSGRNDIPKPGSNGLEIDLKKPERAGSSSSKRYNGECKEVNNKAVSLDEDFEFCVKFIRWLECTGKIETNFRVKFLTWFSLRATPQERRIVNVYIDTLNDDPESLAGQLIDTFTEGISSKRPPPASTGFCVKLWH